MDSTKTPICFQTYYYVQQRNVDVGFEPGRKCQVRLKHLGERRHLNTRFLECG